MFTLVVNPAYLRLPMHAKLVVIVVGVGTMLFAATCVQAARSPAARCKEAKAKAVGRKAAGLLRIMATNKGWVTQASKIAASISREDARFAKAFAAAESKSGCETTNDVQQIEDKVDAFVINVVGTLSRFVDNGDGTITDRMTALLWEKKNKSGGLHDVTNSYTWAGCCNGDCWPWPDQLCQPNSAAAAACSEQTGGAVGCSECLSGTCDIDPHSRGAITTIWDWSVQVNQEGGTGFAGYNDWRIPSEDGCNVCYTDSPPWSCPCGPAELESILFYRPHWPEPCGIHSCIDPIFGLTEFVHWSSTTVASDPGRGWVVTFDDGSVSNGAFKDSHLHVRAVRGGL